MGEERTSSGSISVSSSTSAAAAKKRRVGQNENADRSKYHNRYDPDVPMTSDEVAAWRREERRKRNRDSAAASRQRVRARIVELEAEVAGWKKRFEEAMSKIRSLEERLGAQESPSREEFEPSVVESISSPSFSHPSPQEPEQALPFSPEPDGQGTVVSPPLSPVLPGLIQALHAFDDDELLLSPPLPMSREVREHEERDDSDMALEATTRTEKKHLIDTSREA